MRFVVYGVGAIGGVIGARLYQHGHDVLLVSRGAQYEAIRRNGLRIESPDEALTLRVPVVEAPSSARVTDSDMVILAVKTQDAYEALRGLAAVGPGDAAVACALNGVEGERLAVRMFRAVYGISVRCPAAYLRPGLVQAYSAPVTGILDLGRYPHQHPQAADDGPAADLAAAFRSATFLVEPVADIRAHKYGKLLGNLGNAIEAVCGPHARSGPIDDLARQEAVQCYRAAGIEYQPADDPRTELIKPRPIDGQQRPAGSTWQSLRRGAGSVETDFLNGEIVMLGRTHGVPTPVNERLQVLARQLARQARPPGSMSEVDFLASVVRPDASGP